ncbi:MAG: XRE family transcriptional regulator [Bryobacterales bacterium]|nr:XRE family transcriptional regulator [Bryobacterales bacterium]
MPEVNPEILIWAREAAGLTLQEAVAKVGIRDTRGEGAIERLLALERGEKKPTRPLLVKMAQHYRRPLLAFYLTAPPPRGDRGADFRTLTGARSAETEAVIDALVRNVQSRQNMVRAALEAEDEAETLPFVGALSRSLDTRTDLGSLRNLLRRKPEAALLSRQAAAALKQVLGHNLNAASYYAQPSADQAFTLIRTQIENAGVFVLLKGDLGSYHTDIEVEVFRGFAIADDIAPFIVINDNDSRAAWSFTLLHELTHLLLGQTGISGGRPETEIEEFCNNVAGGWMLPAQTLDDIQIERDQDPVKQQHCIDEFARSRNLSRTMIAYRLFRSGRIDWRTFEVLRSAFREHWRKQRDRQRAKARESEGGPNYYVVRRHRAGKSLLRFSRRMMDSGALSTTKAARILDVKPAHVGKMLRPAQAR